MNQTTEPRVWHYVRPNEQTRVPRSIICLDTQSRTTPRPWGHEESWRLAVAYFRSQRKGRAAHEDQQAFRTPEDLWRAVSDHCGRSGRTVLWAHNLGYDVRISECFVTLPEQGWELVAHNMAPRGTWLVWRRGRANLTMVDSAAVWPTTLAEIGKMFGISRPRISSNEDSETTWLARCESDVRILRTAVLAYLDWIETADLGNWQLTGAGQSWAIYRHKFMSCPLLVHGDDDALAAERRAMWTGRCEAYWHGTILKQVVHEWDLHAAYARVALTAKVPVRLIGVMPPHHDWRKSVDSGRYRVLAEVTVTTEIPTVPAMHDDHILWPVGTFDTTLWDVEITQAIEDGATVKVHRGWLYHADDALADWATWVLNMLTAPDDVVPAWRKAIIKHHARALVGRFAMTYSTWEPFGTMPTLGAERRTVIDEVENDVYDLMQVGTALWRQSDEVEWSQSMPAITGFIMAACRVRLWRILRSLPDDAPLYCDTDSILTTDRFYHDVAAVAATAVGNGLRLKKSWDGFTIAGPRQIVTGARVRMSGIPVLAQQVGRSEFSGQVQESVAVALKSGHNSTVRRVDRTWHTRGVDRRRRGPAVGYTHPVRLPA